MRNNGREIERMGAHVRERERESIRERVRERKREERKTGIWNNTGSGSSNVWGCFG